MKQGMGKFSLLASSLVVLVVATNGYICAQVRNPLDSNSQQPAAEQGTYNNTPLYRIQVVGRNIPAINYFQRKGTTSIGFQGTSLLADASGSAHVRSEPGRTLISARFERLPPANSFGPEYLTYVLWAITPEGRPINLGEVLPGGKKGEGHITVTTNLQAFGLILTAEPYYAVTMPSDLVVAQNYVLHGKTKGKVEEVNAHYSLLPRGAYEQTAGRRAVLHPIKAGGRSPLDLYEAENAVNIAASGGAGQYASDTLATAQQDLNRAEVYDRHKKDRKQTVTYARDAVQSAEDARIITIRKLQAADEQSQRQAQERAQLMAARAQQMAQQQAQARALAEQQQQQAQQEAAAARQAKQQAEQAEQQTAAARQAQMQAQQAAQQSAQQAEQARERLRQQLGQILQTRDTARGLIMNMSDVLFGFNKYELKPDAKVKLAKISGILAAYPDLHLSVEGYTDNIGSPSYNQKLSDERADSVRNFLLSQNVPQTDVTAQGYGENDPIATNSTNSGRAQNRRVQIVVSGAAIGVPGNQTSPAPGTPAPQQ